MNHLYFPFDKRNQTNLLSYMYFNNSLLLWFSPGPLYGTCSYHQYVYYCSDCDKKCKQINTSWWGECSAWPFRECYCYYNCWLSQIMIIYKYIYITKVCDKNNDTESIRPYVKSSYVLALCFGCFSILPCLITFVCFSCVRRNAGFLLMFNEYLYANIFFIDL